MTIAALIIGSFEDDFEKAAILAVFIPVVMSMARNAGQQASVVSVRALAMWSNWPGDHSIFRFGREFLGALLNGAIAGSILAVLIFSLPGRSFSISKTRCGWRWRHPCPCSP